MVAISCFGWFPGGIVFPVALDHWTGPLEVGDYVHFAASFVLSGLIAATYVYFGAQFIVVRVLYPRMWTWTDPSGVRTQAQRKRTAPDSIGNLLRFQFLAVLIPLIGAALLIDAGTDELSLPFRLLVTMLLVLGIAGLSLANRMCNYLTRFAQRLTGRESEDFEPSPLRSIASNRCSVGAKPRIRKIAIRGQGAHEFRRRPVVGKNLGKSRHNAPHAGRRLRGGRRPGRSRRSAARVASRNE